MLDTPHARDFYAFYGLHASWRIETQTRTKLILRADKVVELTGLFFIVAAVFSVVIYVGLFERSTFNYSVVLFLAFFALVGLIALNLRRVIVVDAASRQLVATTFTHQEIKVDLKKAKSLLIVRDEKEGYTSVYLLLNTSIAVSLTNAGERDARNLARALSCVCDVNTIEMPAPFRPKEVYAYSSLSNSAPMLPGSRSVPDLEMTPSIRAAARSKSRSSGVRNEFVEGTNAFLDGRYQDAEFLLCLWLEAHPTHVEAYYWRGCTRVEDSRLVDAREDFAKVVTLEPSHRYAERCRELLARSQPQAEIPHP